MTPPAPTALPTGEEKTQLVRSMFDTIAPRYEFVNKLMTFGLDRSWRRRTVRSLGLPKGSVLLDLATGTGDLIREGRRSGFVVIGCDLSYGMLAANHTGAALVEASGASLPFVTGSLDGLLCGYALRNFTDLQGSFDEMARVVRPGGRIAILEVAAPSSKFLKFGYSIWFERIVPKIGALLSDRDAYAYLPKSTAYLPPTEELRTMVRSAGFSAVNIHMLNGGLSQLISATRTGLPT